MAEKELLFTKENHVATITLNRPESYNAISDNMRAELRSVADELGRDNEIWVVVLTGAGKAFCAGGDIKLMKRRLESDISYRERLEAYRRDVADMVRDLSGIRQLMIAKINGPAFGAGCSIALLCDVRIASDGARFGLPFGKRGLIPDWGATYFLPRIVGLSRAVSLCSTGRSLDAREALGIGLVDHVAPHQELDEYIKAYCADVLQSSPFSVMKGKAAMRGSLDSELDSVLEREARLQSMCYLSDDHREGVDCFLEKREAKFTGK